MVATRRTLVASMASLMVVLIRDSVSGVHALGWPAFVLLVPMPPVMARSLRFPGDGTSGARELQLSGRSGPARVITR